MKFKFFILLVMISSLAGCTNKNTAPSTANSTSPSTVSSGAIGGTVALNNQNANAIFQDCKNDISITQIAPTEYKKLEALMRKHGYVFHSDVYLSQDELPTTESLQKGADNLGICAILYSIEHENIDSKKIQKSTTIPEGANFVPPYDGEIISRELVGRLGAERMEVEIKYEYLQKTTRYDLRVSYWKKIANFNPAEDYTTVIHSESNGAK